jgi:hypothetical protein
MGFFSKLFKKVKKGFKSAFKSIGNAVKKTFKGFGKFMGKIGIVGQLAMSFVLPGIGDALMKTAGQAFSGLTGVLGSSGNAILKSAGKMLEAGGNFAKMGHSAFKTVGEGISSFVSEMGHAALSKVPGIQNVFPNITDKKFSTAWNNVQEKFNANADKVSAAFNDLIGNTKPMTTATQANVLAQSQAVTGTGTTPSSTAEIKGFEGFEATETPEFIDTSKLQEVEVPDNFEMGKPEFKVEKPKVEINIPEPTVKTESLLDRGVDFVTEAGREAKQDIIKRIEEAPQKAGQYVGEKVEEAIVASVVGEDEAPVESYGSAGPASYQQVDVGQYNSPAMNDRAYQMAVNPVGFGMQNPFGYTAQDSYQQQMLQFTRPQYG